MTAPTPTEMLAEAVRAALLREDLGPELHAQLAAALSAHEAPQTEVELATVALAAFVDALNVPGMTPAEAIGYLSDAIDIIDPEFADIQNDNGTVSESEHAEDRHERFDDFACALNWLKLELTGSAKL